jgi:hypothetical protein
MISPRRLNYRLGDAKTGFYAEFLTPLFGPEHGRDGKLTPVTVAAAGGHDGGNGVGGRRASCGE